jgi:hypothetical protein
VSGRTAIEAYKPVETGFELVGYYQMSDLPKEARTVRLHANPGRVHLPDNLPILFSGIEIAPEAQGDGLVTPLLNHLIAELEQQGNLIHVETFTPDGMRAIYPKARERGYAPLPLRRPHLMPEHCRQLQGWLYRQY